MEKFIICNCGEKIILSDQSNHTGYPEYGFWGNAKIARNVKNHGKKCEKFNDSIERETLKVMRMSQEEFSRSFLFSNQRGLEAKIPVPISRAEHQDFMAKFRDSEGSRG